MTVTDDRPSLDDAAAPEDAALDAALPEDRPSTTDLPGLDGVSADDGIASDVVADDAVDAPATTDSPEIPDTPDVVSAPDVVDAGPPDTGCQPAQCNDNNVCTRDLCMMDRCVNLPLDRDSDGEGPTRVEMQMCAGGRDCDDLNRDVNSAQRSFFETAYTPVLGGSATFDYNCDGREEQEFPSRSQGLCSLVGTAACRPITAGWDRVVPRCGEMGDFETGQCVRQVGVCLPVTERRRQRCR